VRRDGRLNILQISTADRLGGAEAVALRLHRALRAQGHDATLAVGRRFGAAPGVVEIAHAAATGAWRGLWWRVHQRLQPAYRRSAFARRVCRMAHRLASPAGRRDRRAGREDFDYPGVWRVLDALPARPDVIHLHNLHGGYFDLRALGWLTARAPVVWTLHDMWALTGHCAHALGCERWRSGCGACPDLAIYPAVRRDATAANWRAKQAIYERCGLHVVTPSAWLWRQVARSMLGPAVDSLHVIPYGVDTQMFKPGDRRAARRQLGLPVDRAVVLFVAHGAERNPFKDYATVRAAAERLRAMQPQGRAPICLAVGAAAGDAVVRGVPAVDSPEDMCLYYQAADVYVHAARADTFPNTVLEALACGTPVVATAVGGIAEQVRPLASCLTAEGAVIPRAPVKSATGILVPPGAAGALANGVARLLVDEALRNRLAANAARDGYRRFGLARQVAGYGALYEEILNGRAAARDAGESMEVGGEAFPGDDAEVARAHTVAASGPI